MMQKIAAYPVLTALAFVIEITCHRLKLQHDDYKNSVGASAAQLLGPDVPDNFSDTSSRAGFSTRYTVVCHA